MDSAWSTSTLLVPSAHTSVLKDTQPRLMSGPGLSKNVALHYKAGPSGRTQNLGPTTVHPTYGKMHRHPIERFGLESSTPTNWYPTGSETCLEPPAILPSIVTGDPTFEILLHYRVIDPDAATMLPDSSEGFIIDRLFAETATVTTLTLPVRTVPICGDTKVQLTLQEALWPAFGVILEAVGKASGLGQFLRTIEDSKVRKWMWAVYAECASLSERVTIGNWSYIREALQHGGWWLRVYLVETEPQSGNMWATKA